MPISNDGVMINNRFFLVTDVLKDMGRMEGGLRAFCERHQINRSMLSQTRANADKTVLKPDIIKWLCEDYGANIEFIMFGKGKMLK